MAAINYTFLANNLGKQNIGVNGLSGRALYTFLYSGSSVAGGGVVVGTAIATVEATGTSYARQSCTVGAMDATGVSLVPSTAWTVGAGVTNWPSDVFGWGLASASSAGIALGYWDHMRTCATTNTSTTVTVNGSGETTTGLVVGSKVQGVGIPASTTISSITDSTHFVISNAATATTNPVVLAISCDMSKALSVFTSTAVNLFYKNPFD